MTILVFNAGSSSLKFALYRLQGEQLRRSWHGQYELLPGNTRFRVYADGDVIVVDDKPPVEDHEQAMAHLWVWMEEKGSSSQVAAAGHRVVHGGRHYHRPVRVDAEVLDQLHRDAALAPLHMPHNLAAIESLARHRPGLAQVACFDTGFHHAMPAVEQRYALPDEWFGRGVRRYGFHGLSYEYIASVLPTHLAARAEGRVIVAHLGHGASLCAMRELRSVATTMGFTPLDGIPMATRPGHLDPGVVTWMQREAGLGVDEVEELLNHRSGLLGLSGLSADMRALLASDAPGAKRAIDYFVHHTARAIASLAGALGGLDALVFTAGIGEHSPVIRARICDAAAWLGIGLDEAANERGERHIGRTGFPVAVCCIPTDEEQMIARHTLRLLNAPG